MMLQLREQFISSHPLFNHFHRPRQPLLPLRPLVQGYDDRYLDACMNLDQDDHHPPKDPCLRSDA